MNYPLPDKLKLSDVPPYLAVPEYKSAIQLLMIEMNNGFATIWAGDHIYTYPPNMANRLTEPYLKLLQSQGGDSVIAFPQPLNGDIINREYTGPRINRETNTIEFERQKRQKYIITFFPSKPKPSFWDNFKYLFFNKKK